LAYVQLQNSLVKNNDYVGSAPTNYRRSGEEE